MKPENLKRLTLSYLSRWMDAAEEINAALARGLRRQPHDLYAALTEPHADEAEFMRAAVAE